MVALQEQAELVQEAEDSGEAERKRQKQAARDADVEAEYNARFEERKAKWKAIQVRVPPTECSAGCRSVRAGCGALGTLVLAHSCNPYGESLL